MLNISNSLISLRTIRSLPWLNRNVIAHSQFSFLNVRDYTTRPPPKKAGSSDAEKPRSSRPRVSTSDEFQKTERSMSGAKYSEWSVRDEDAKRLNKSLGLGKDAKSAGGRGSSRYKGSRPNAERKNSGLRDARMKESQTSGSLKDMVKGFLELNPYICSGCGSSFQSKSENDTGFLPKDILQEHFHHAKEIQERQDAIRILDLAGIELDSDLAESVLREAKKSPEVIAGVRNFGRAQKKQAARLEPLAVAPEGILEDDDVDEWTVIESTGESEFHFPELDKLRETEDVFGLIPSEAMMRAAINNSLLPRKYRKTKYDPDHREVANFPTAPTSEFDSEEARLLSVSEIVQGERLREQLPELQQKPSSEDSVCICQRCFRLQQYGKVEQVLRPGWSDLDSVAPDKFVQLLEVIKNSKAVVLCILDVFDLQGSLVKNLKSIAGSNPIVIAVNKVDLLPKDASLVRMRSWIYDEVKSACGFQSPKDKVIKPSDDTSEIDEIGDVRRKKGDKKLVEAEAGVLRQGNVHLISCSSGKGITELMNSVTKMSEGYGNTVYVMGAANVGKSSFINLLLENKLKPKGVKQGSQRKSDMPQATVSPLPGTTLNFLKIKMRNGFTFIDTPGLISASQLTARLTSDELKAVIPSKSVTPVTLRVQEGYSVMIGGLATIELVQGRPFFLTFFVSSQIPIRPTLSENVPNFVEKHIGELIFPPNTLERFNELKPFDTHEFEITGQGWLLSSTDIVVSGLGWVSVTGCGKCVLRVTAPSGVAVECRQALLPHEAKASQARFTGGRLELTGAKGKRGFRR